MSARIKIARRMHAGDPGRPRSMPGVGYVQGDPGLFGLIGGAIALGSKVVKAIKGSPKPASPVTQARAQYQVGWRERLAMGATRDPSTGKVSGVPGQMPVPGFQGAMQRFLPGGQTGYVQGRSTAVPREQGPPAPGYHLNKSGYFLKSGQYIAPQSVWVKNRRRNPFNPRAIDRAIGRIESGKRAAKRLGRITVRKKCAA